MLQMQMLWCLFVVMVVVAAVFAANVFAVLSLVHRGGVEFALVHVHASAGANVTWHAHPYE